MKKNVLSRDGPATLTGCTNCFKLLVIIFIFYCRNLILGGLHYRKLIPDEQVLCADLMSSEESGIRLLLWRIEKAFYSLDQKKKSKKSILMTQKEV